ncbi:MAG: FHA domain-containing protein [Acidimicrobiia bacterium]|nr:FHA domain-containing protein [Acidimicrobiia bacterium]
MSRRHATISATRDSLQISDGYGGAPSTHGTKVDGQRLAPHVPFATQSAATVTLADVATLYCRPGA